jgi:hypothetical protein
LLKRLSLFYNKILIKNKNDVVLCNENHTLTNVFEKFIAELNFLLAHELIENLLTKRLTFGIQVT